MSTAYAGFHLMCLLLCLVLDARAQQDDRPLTPRDFQNAKLFQERKPDEHVLEIAGKWEGDIMISDQLHGDLQSDNAIRGSNYRWSDSEVPYEVSSEFTDYERSRIANAIAHYEQRTCLKFIPRTSESDFVKFFKGTGCWSYVGRHGGLQKVSIGSGCANTGIIIHEMMHAAGFFHEQSRNDRDEYVTIVEGNIKDGAERNFRKISGSKIYQMGMQYDYGSVMHYGPKAFSKNGRRTIIAPQKIGQRDGLSSTDIAKVNKLYCRSGPRPTITRRPGWRTTKGPKATPRPFTKSPNGCVDRLRGCARFHLPNFCRQFSDTCCRSCTGVVTNRGGWQQGFGSGRVRSNA